jgi:uncharacterized protein
MGRFRPAAACCLLLTGWLAIAVSAAQPAMAVSENVVVSQVYGGGGNSGATLKADFIELFNRGTSGVDLSTWSVQYASSTGSTWQRTNLSGTIAPGQYYLVQEGLGAGGTDDLPTPDAVGTIPMSATAGKVALVASQTTLVGACPSGVVDFVGYGATACAETAPAPGLTNTTAALRNSGGCSDTDSNAADFTTGAPTPRNSSSTSPCVTLVSVDDVSMAEQNAGVTSFNFMVSLSMPAGPGGLTFDIATADGTASATSDYTAKSLTGQTILEGSQHYTFSVLVNGDTGFEGDETFFVNITNVTGATVADGQGLGTILNDDADCAAVYTPAYAIQGGGLVAAITGTVSTQGVVTGDYEYPGSGPTSAFLRGFYLQDPTGDDDPATSDGIFVFNGNSNSVNLGDVVRVTGTAAEFQDQTQISASSVLSCGAQGTVSPVDVTLPRATATDLEPYEGMLVRLPQTLSVAEHFQLGRFGQVVVSSGGRLPQPTNVAAPGGPAQAQQAANDLNRIIIDDASQAQNPDPILFGRNGQTLSASNTLRGGDTATGTVGVMSYTWAGNAASGNAFRVRPVNALGGSVTFVGDNPRPTAPPPVGGTVRVVGMNLLNFFNTFADGNASTPGCFPGGTDNDCRGANSATEFARQYQKTVAAILAMSPDVVGVNEIENDGYGPTSAVQFLVDQLNLATASGTYRFIDVDADTGQTNAMGTDAIKVAMLYKPGVVTPVGHTAALNTVAFVNGGDGSPRSRPSLAQAFEVNTTGARFVVDVNHLKSKGSACDAPDAGDGQGNCNQVRVNAATQLVSWLTSDPTGTGDPDVLLIGDYNSYAKEDPITVIRNAGYTNLIDSLIGPHAYSYVFDGQWGYLDHALGSLSILGQVNGVAEYHINADEPSVLDYNVDFKSAGQVASLYAPDQYRVSDHDPVIVGLTPNASPTVDAGGPYSVVEGHTVTLSASGSDPNGDTLTYAWDLDDNGSFETPGQSVSFTAPTAPATLMVHVRVTDAGGLTAVDDATIHVIWAFAGFFSPISNLPALNSVNPGQAVPVKFSLGGDKGLAILAAGSPSVSEPVDCAAPVAGPSTAAVSAGSLQYDRRSQQYQWTWKTSGAFAGTCRILTVTLVDGTSHQALFKFKH